MQHFNLYQHFLVPACLPHQLKDIDIQEKEIKEQIKKYHAIGARWTSELELRPYGSEEYKNTISKTTHHLVMGGVSPNGGIA